MEELNKEELYNKLLQIAEKYKDTEMPQWNTETREEATRVLMQLCEKISGPRVLYLEPAAEMTEESKRLLEELKEKLKRKSFIMTEPIDITLNVEEELQHTEGDQ